MSIRLDPNHGVNPSVQTCFLCGEDKGLILFGKLNAAQRQAFEEFSGPDKTAAPRRICLDKEPCDKCKELQAEGIILISIDVERSSDLANPYRTGGWCVVTEEAIKRIFSHLPVEGLSNLLAKRAAFIDDFDWDLVGLPRGEG